MKLSAAEEYGLRCLLYVARHESTGSPEPVGIPEISAAEGLSPSNTAKLMRLLRQGGLVESLRGAQGGYRLAMPPQEITILQAVVALDGEPFSRGGCDTAARRGELCVHQSDCSLRVLWARMARAMKDILQSLSVATLLRDEASMERLLEPSKSSVPVKHDSEEST